MHDTSADLRSLLDRLKGAQHALIEDAARQPGLPSTAIMDQLPAAEPKLLALDEGTEAKRAQLVSESFGSTAPGLVQYTTDVLFRQVWLRPDLAPRDRSLVTVSALVASGHVAQLPFSPQQGDGWGLDADSSRRGDHAS